MNDRRARDLSRRNAGKIPSRDRILIVTEGEKTEVNYFNEMRKQLRISSMKLKVVPSSIGTDPISVVNYAERLIAKGLGKAGTENSPKAFEKVFAVFDRDQNFEAFYRARQQIGKFNGKYKTWDTKTPISFSSIGSAPNFELWLLLHFEALSPCEMHIWDPINRLRKHLPDYEKNDSSLFKKTQGRLQKALQNADRLNSDPDRKRADIETEVPVLIRELLKTPGQRG